MNIEHHVSEALLLSYAAGSLGEAWSLAIATHAALCPKCRGSIAQAEAVGGALIDDIEPAPMAENAFNDAISAKIGAALENRRKELSGTFVKSVPAEENDEEN